MRNFKNYKVWELGHRLTLKIYRITEKFPASEKLGLISQMRRAAYSMPSNIAEGCGRQSDKEFVRYLYIANGSATELEYFMILGKDLGFITEVEFEESNEELEVLKKSLNKLISSISQ